MRSLVLLLATAGCAAVADHAGASPKAGQSRPPVVAEPATRCNFGAFVAETDPAGLNVRAAPSPTAKVLGKLPPTFIEPSAGYGVRVEVEVIDARSGWFLIQNAQDNDALTGQPPRPMYSGQGWVSGNKLTVKSQADVGRSAPSPKAPATLRIGDGETFDNDTVIAAARLVDCKGTWAQVEFAEQRFAAEARASLKVDASARTGLPAGRFRVWVDRLCAIQETSCPSLGAPEEAP